MSAEDEFERQLQIFQSECNEALRFFYARDALLTSAHVVPRAASGLNKAPLFWSTALDGLRTASVVALGRMFDPDTRNNHSIARLLAFAHANLEIFSAGAVRRRLVHQAGSGMFRPPSSVYVATGEDFRRLKALVSVRRREYEALIKPLRHARYAHRAEAGFERGPVDVDAVRVRKLVGFFPRLHGALWRLYFDGQKPLIKPARYSTDRMLKMPSTDPTKRSLQERLVQDVEYVLGLCIRDAAP